MTLSKAILTVIIEMDALLQRRDFIMLMAAAGAAVVSPLLDDLHLQSCLMLESLYIPKEERRPGMPYAQLGISHGDLSRPSEKMDLPLFGHQILLSRKNPHLGFTVEKWTGKAAFFDWAEKKVIATINLPAGKMFNGHAFYNGDDESKIYCAVSEKNVEQSFLLVLESRTLKILEQLTVGKGFTHDCQYDQHSGKVMVTTNWDKGSTFYWLDPKSMKAIRTVDFNDATLNGLSHFYPLSSGDVIISGKSKKIVSPEKTVFGESVPPLVVLRKNGDWVKLEMPEGFKAGLHGEGLSIAVDEKRKIAAVTYPYANVVGFWNYESAKLLTKLEMPDPNGIARLKGSPHFLITSSYEEIFLLNVDDLSSKRLKTPPSSVKAGPHLTYRT